MVRSRAADKDAGATPLSSQQVSPDTKFEAALQELEQVVRDMESGQLSLEDSIAAFHKGSELLRHCQNQLCRAEQQIRILEGGLLRDFDELREETR